HFAQFDIIGGKLLDDGRYQRPVVSLVCNFTPGVGDDPALMNHGEVETIFHEFGHAMHSILTRAKYQRFSGANVARDFVEAPSQMFEAWVWDPEVLQRFAIDWRDGESVIPMETLANMKKAKLATVGVFYRRQMGLALADLRMHVAEVGADAGKICNAANAEVLFEPPANTNFAAYWGHLTGYDAGYYGYGWADSIAADMGTIFENAPNRFLDKEVGMRLRNEIYSVGGSRDADISIIRFLGRERSNDAFLESIGIE
ncbi:MAG TPA: M3 family metallopeptidase, partial [Planctomycetota bacterium]|nr:M3 family metallopeptidase [Planctomycetota bacterium]